MKHPLQVQEKLLITTDITSHLMVTLTPVQKTPAQNCGMGLVLYRRQFPSCTLTASAEQKKKKGAILSIKPCHVLRNEQNVFKMQIKGICILITESKLQDTCLHTHFFHSSSETPVYRELVS